MTNSTNIIKNIVTQKKYKEKYHWTDYFSYFYLFLGVFLMFGPIIWLGLSSVKTLAGIQEYPPTILPLSVCLVILFGISSVNAATLTDRLKDGHKLRLGFGTAVPWAYAGDNGEALGFVNMIALTVLEEMGITEHETKVFEWSGLIPGINANRSDMITGGMYILKSRCENMDFSDPIGVFGD